VALYARLHYDDGSCTPLTEVPVTEEFGPVQITIPSVDNAVVTSLEITDEEDQCVSRTPVDLYLRVVDALEVTVIPPVTGWPGQAFFSKQVDEAAAADMRNRLQIMASRLHNHQEQFWLKDQAHANDWIKRGLENQPTGDYL
jgi:hypothetical protein